MFSISFDEEYYSGEFETIEHALQEGYSRGDVFWVGELVPPTQPEDWWDAADWLEHVSCQDEYCCEWSEDWEGSTKEQREELESLVRKVMSDWLDRHDLRPKFFNVENAVKYVKSHDSNGGGL